VSDLSCLTRILVTAIGMLTMTGQVFGDPRATLLDPTRPKGWQATAQAQAETEEQPVRALKLQGTFSLAGKRSAVISGRRVEVGDEVSGAQVLEINKNKVTLRLDGETIELASTVPDVKSPANFEGDRR